MDNIMASTQKLITEISANATSSTNAIIWKAFESLSDRCESIEALVKCKGGNEITGEVHAQDVEEVEECDDEEKEYDLEEIEKMELKLYSIKRHACQTVH